MSVGETLALAWSFFTWFNIFLTVLLAATLFACALILLVVKRVIRDASADRRARKTAANLDIPEHLRETFVREYKRFEESRGSNDGQQQARPNV
jgi:flagellar biosynthesis/type III secretory pathway M-ring protein FliF/YscJ